MAVTHCTVSTWQKINWSVIWNSSPCFGLIQDNKESVLENVHSEEILKVNLPQHHHNNYCIRVCTFFSSHITPLSHLICPLLLSVSTIFRCVHTDIILQLTEQNICIFLLFSRYFHFLFTDKQKHNFLLFSQPIDSQRINTRSQFTQSIISRMLQREKTLIIFSQSLELGR